VKKLENTKLKLCRILSKIGAIKFGTFKLTSGKLSPYYIDLRVVPSFPDAFKEICDIYIQLIEKELGTDTFDRVAGITTAGIPFASVVAYKLGKPFLYVRKGIKRHGRERRVEGVITPGDKIIIVDDLITTGRTLKNAARAIRAEGGIVEDAVVLIDREEGGFEVLVKDGIKLHYFLKVSEVAKKLHEIGVLSDEELETILSQIEKTQK